jgi:hypothetical protein
MEGNEGPPKKSIGQRLAQIPDRARRIYSKFVPGGEEPLPGEETTQEFKETDSIEIEDVAWAVGALLEEGDEINTGGILKILGVGKSDKTDYFKKTPDEYRRVNRLLQQLVDEKALTRIMLQDKETNAVSATYAVINKDRIRELAQEETEE